ncbi:MAG: NACHT domain-containing protein [Thermodesulfovibrionales bacterium]
MTDIYISRKLLEREIYYQHKEYFSLLWETKLVDLVDLVISDKKKIVLLGDAGYGKSTELRRVAGTLMDERNPNVIPILVELNTYVDENMSDYVTTKIGADSKHLLDHKSKLLFLFDEFDQVLNKEIATRKIKQFAESYSESSFVISCRTNFYSGQFEEFSSFVILPFDLQDISSYSRQLLKAKADIFLHQLMKSPLLEVSRNPFFLKHITRIFEADDRLPERLSDVLSRIVSISIESDIKKLLTKYDIEQKYSAAEIKRDLAYMALVMETLQKNYISIEDFHQILPDNFKRQVITELSLIKKAFFKEGDVYQFQHNNFQEELAAEVLSGQALNTILEFISYRSVDKRPLIEKLEIALGYFDVKPFGIRITRILLNVISSIKYKSEMKKINPSWVNTAAFLCLLREKSDLFDYLALNHPELALKFEPDRVDNNEKESLFKTIFEKYTSQEIPIDRDIDYEDLAKFARTAGHQSKIIYDYLMNYARSNKQYDKYNAISILSKMKEFKTDALIELLIKYAKSDNEKKNFRHLCFYALAGLGMTGRNTIDQFRTLKHSGDDWLLSGLYYLIKESEAVDDYVDILLSGLPRIRLVLNEKESRLGDESWNLIKGLEKVTAPAGVRKIIRHFIDKPEDIQEFYVDKSLERLVVNFISAYNQDSLIYEDVKELLKTTQNKYIDSAFGRLYVFFMQTDTVLTLFKDILKENIDDNYRLLALIADEDCVEFLAEEYHAGKLTDENMNAIVHYLQFNKDYEHLLKIINDTTGKFYPTPARDHNKEQEEELKRKVNVIFSKADFLKEAEVMFMFKGQDALSLADIDNILHKSYRDRTCNNFVVLELRQHILSTRGNKEWTLAEIKSEIDRWDYKWFTVSHVFDLLYHGAQYELSESQRVFISEFCTDQLSTVHFKTALSAEENGETTTTNRLAVYLWYFLRKLDFAYPEGTLLDMLSYDWIENSGFVGISYLENKLPSEKVKKRILQNLSEGIFVDQVLRNHIAYCRKYKLTEAANYLSAIIENQGIKIETRLLALDAIADLPDTSAFLEKLLNIKELKLFIRAAEILMALDSIICEHKLIEKLSSEDETFALEAARLLIEKQNIKAIKFYADYLKKTKKFSSGAFGKTALSNIQTIKALPIILDLLRFSYECGEEIVQDEYFPLHGAVIGIIKNISRQNYSNFTAVRKQLRKFIEKNWTRFENINYLNAVYNDLEKDFYINYKHQMSIGDVISKVRRMALR